MSKRWPGGIITKNQATPTGPYENGSAPGIWTLNQMSYWVKQALWPTAGNVNPSAFIENLFSTYLYTGNGSTQTITNGIDLSGKGGMVWLKDRSNARNHNLYDTARGATYAIQSNLTDAQSVRTDGLTGFSSTGFNLGNFAQENNLNETYASWTFREQPKFFDVVTYTGNGTARTIAHNLGSVPGCIIVKRTDTTAAWAVYHRGSDPASGAPQDYRLTLNTTDARFSQTVWNNTAPTSSVFSLGTSTDVNASGGTYVAYIYAHNAGGFGLSGTENVISCGEVGTFDNTVNLGWEPQWILFKRANGASEWYIWDTMRGITYTFNGNYNLQANTSAAEANDGYITPITNGFQSNLTGSYIYIAIRRGPMQVPTLGTSVFYPTATLPTGVTQNTNILTSGFPIDSTWRLLKDAAGTGVSWVAAEVDRLRGNGSRLSTNLTDSESAVSNSWAFDSNTSIVKRDTGTNNYGTTQFAYAFKRAPGFFDVVCYTGTGVARNINHNLTVAPELMIVKCRSTGGGWATYNATIGNTKYLNLQTTDAASVYSGYWNNTSPTSSVFTVATDSDVNTSAATYIAYLFATVAGVSKVGSYTGTAATLNINAGFTTGARFVMIKRTDSTGNWFVWDTARGMVAGTDPRLALNSTAAELNNNWVYTASSGFQIVTTDASVNASGGSYIYLAIA